MDITYRSELKYLGMCVYVYQRNPELECPGEIIKSKTE